MIMLMLVTVLVVPRPVLLVCVVQFLSMLLVLAPVIVLLRFLHPI